MSRRLLIVATVPVSPAVLRSQVPELDAPEEIDVRVVSPVSDLTFGQWLANEEGDARAEAEKVATETAGKLAAEPAVEAATVGAEVGDTDPVLAAEDALRTSPADEIIVVLPGEGPPERDPTFLERESPGSFERLGLPVRYVFVGAGKAES